MAMTCPSCGRPLASGARCVYCGQGTKVQARQPLNIPKGTVPERGGKSGFPWGKIVFFLILAGAVAACFLHPELNARIRSVIPF
jgi:hypothetical protein